jgi:putative colanic acid biosynthesis acetyltransferase WcaF
LRNSHEPVETPRPAWVDLEHFGNAEYRPGRGRIVRTIWYAVSVLIFESGWLPISAPKRWLLRWFGARIGRGLVIKPHVRIKYPWRFAVGDHCWIGQEVWIDNLDDVRLGDHVCVSQRTYLCTGSHDYRQRGFNLVARPIHVENGAWLGAQSLILGGVTVRANAIVAAGSVVSKDVAEAEIVAGNPARPLDRKRTPPEESWEFPRGDG